MSDQEVKTEFKPEVMTEDAVSIGKIIAVVGIMLLVVLVSMYIFNLIKSNSLKEIAITTKVLQLDNKVDIPFTVGASELTAPLRGQEFSYNFWIYLKDTYSASSSHKVIFQRGPTVAAANTNYTTLAYNTHIVAAMHKSANTFMVAVNTDMVTTAMTLEDIFKKNTVTKRFDSPYVVASIDYVPLQRWVNISVSVREHLMTIYVDGDLYSIISTNDVKGSSSNTDRRAKIQTPTGDITVGNSGVILEAYLSLLKFYNYSLTQTDIAKIYNNGPITKTFLSWFGLSRYGLRNPVYEIQ